MHFQSGPQDHLGWPPLKGDIIQRENIKKAQLEKNKKGPLIVKASLLQQKGAPPGYRMILSHTVNKEDDQQMAARDGTSIQKESENPTDIYQM
ncbi:hypothetical protein CEXT_774041 [Caerostris extrusa]|uniref:Uncharacterized protein n=1 Tax=Caerostris extrusa TaxID=172846 RepID=A0AAV4NWE4_CAEEX|nr:hypothetical protein CEXT_774041 [Caerostris extrusa]